MSPGDWPLRKISFLIGEAPSTTRHPDGVTRASAKGSDTA